MAKVEIEVKKSVSVFDEIDRLHRVISQRAYDLFEKGHTCGGALADWLTAERELISKPAVELRQQDGQFEVHVALPGINAKDLDVQITPEDLMIKAETTQGNDTDKGTIHVSEFSPGEIVRSVHFPERIDPDSVKTNYKNGMLQLTVSIAKTSTARKVDIKAA